MPFNPATLRNQSVFIDTKRENSISKEIKNIQEMNLLNQLPPPSLRKPIIPQRARGGAMAGGGSSFSSFNKNFKIEPKLDATSINPTIEEEKS